MKMTAAQWRKSKDPSGMLWSLHPSPSERKQRLFAVACCRRVWDQFPDNACRRAVEVAERLADGDATQDEWFEAMLPAARVGWDEDGNDVLDPLAAAASSAGHGYDADIPAGLIAQFSRQRDEATIQSHLVRCIFGNPFRPMALDPQWRTSTVVQLTQGIYAERAFDRLPILADALQDAGCDHADVLAHCRDTGPHARGCWVVDLILGKA